MLKPKELLLIDFPLRKIHPFWLTENTIMHFTWLCLSLAYQTLRNVTTWVLTLFGLTNKVTWLKSLTSGNKISCHTYMYLWIRGLPVSVVSCTLFIHLLNFIFVFPQELASGKPDSEKVKMLTEKINALLEQVREYKMFNIHVQQ